MSAIRCRQWPLADAGVLKVLEKMRLLTLIAIVLLRLLDTGVSAAHETTDTQQAADAAVPWVLPELIPMALEPGNPLGTGFGFSLTAGLQALLSTEQHAPVTVMAVARIVGLAAKGRLVCTAGLLYSPERARYFAFSRPMLQILPNRLIVRNEEAGRLGAGPDGLDVEAMLNQGRRIVLVRGRAFGPPLDGIIQRHADRFDWVMDSVAAFNLVARGRADATIDFATSLVVEQRRQQGLEALNSLTIKGSALLDYQVACTANERGRALIDRLNATMDGRIRALAFTGYSQWLDSEAREFLRQALLKQDPNFPALKQEPKPD
jgi:uncharacterized protein (TIGR02285 family)